ncbi:hypothetical protein [uncultured Parasphingorhabdus sp.]|uniref:hypothetical protein n=1 Tax=uncultured Parasphingorhabdus sp. TaxID=2709694 RepID=UPI002AA88531|nr:hypothetical protein [uncultured Parasphingorhabdus sp.]
MQPPKPNARDFFGQSTLDEGLSSLQTHFADWETADDRGKHSLWKLLGKAYALGSEIAENDLIRSALISKVSDDPDVAASNRWNAETKHPFDLLLVLLLGLTEETKATKSQWLRTLKTAQTQSIDPTPESFLAWIEKLGGVDAALKLGRKPRPPKLKLSEMVTAIPEPDNFENLAFDMPLKLSDDDLPEGYGLVIVKKTNDGDQLLPLGTIVNERQVSEAVRTFVAELARQQRENERLACQEEEDREKLMRKKAKSAYYAIEKSKRWTTEFEEFFEVWKVENPDEDRQPRNPYSVPSSSQ